MSRPKLPARAASAVTVARAVSVQPSVVPASKSVVRVRGRAAGLGVVLASAPSPPPQPARSGPAAATHSARGRTHRRRRSRLVAIAPGPFALPARISATRAPRLERRDQGRPLLTISTVETGLDLYEPIALIWQGWGGERPRERHGARTAGHGCRGRCRARG